MSGYWMGVLTGVAGVVVLALGAFIFGVWRVRSRLERDELARTRERTARMRALEAELRLLADQATALERLTAQHAHRRTPPRADLS